MGSNLSWLILTKGEKYMRERIMQNSHRGVAISVAILFTVVALCAGLSGPTRVVVPRSTPTVATGSDNSDQNGDEWPMTHGGACQNGTTENGALVGAYAATSSNTGQYWSVALNEVPK